MTYHDGEIQTRDHKISTLKNFFWPKESNNIHLILVGYLPESLVLVYKAPKRTFEETPLFTIIYCINNMIEHIFTKTVDPLYL